MLDTQMSGVTQKEAETGAAPEESREEEGIYEKKTKKKRRNVISDASRGLGFGQCAAFTYEEVWMRKP